MSVGGLVTETSYPYKGMQLARCLLDHEAFKHNINGFTALPKMDEYRMKIWLAKRGPVSIAINASAMQFYKRGVSNPGPMKCPERFLNHVVLIIGYGVESPTQDAHLPYWIIKNSWGTDFGERGYYRVYRSNNTCGLAIDPTTSVVLFYVNQKSQ